MTASTRQFSLMLLLLFVLSGIAGLIYQSIWSHYLGLTLGHAAYAQALVLGIFMGGMALGAWLASRWSPRLGDLVLAYAIVEAVIGVIGLVFHPVFLGYTWLSQELVLPAIGQPGLAHAWQWLSAALLILPQCILLGATFPLLSAGLMRKGGEADGRILGGLYFANSLGAAAGALLTTFYLLPRFGMPGSVTTAGLLNLLVAVLAWLVWKRIRHAPADNAAVGDVATETAPSANRDRRISGTLLFAAAITGATSFIYEIGWVRMLNQSLGTTIHSFELMLAAFIFGLACGGLYVRIRGASLRDPVALAGVAQILMGVCALLSLIAFARSFQWVGWMMQALDRTDQGYTLFSAGSAVVSLVVMFPAAFFAGMTLPLFTVALLRNGDGERAIGRVYAANTLGAIVGVVLMIHVLTPLMGIRVAVMVAALADAALGLYLLRFVSPGRMTRVFVLGALATLLALGESMLLGKVDPLQQVSGVFRTGKTHFSGELHSVPFLRDGKTATVSVLSNREGLVAISTNGKPDASMDIDMRGTPTVDEVTMLMLGALPFVHHPEPKRISVIGWGSGLTTHTLAGSSVPELIETVEIESVMHEGARLFGDRVARAYNDPRSKLRVEDARTYFSTGNRKYDVIVSEPSNPWVSGVASLFTKEFYRFIRGHLERDGVLVQWIHVYELDEKLLATMITALLDVFPDSELYVTQDTDLILVAHAGQAASPRYGMLEHEPLAGELRRVGLGSPDEFALRRIGGSRLLQAYVKHFGAQPHSDFYPVVSLNAPRSRFKEETADGVLALVDNGLPVLDMLEGRTPPATDKLAVTEDSRFSEAAQLARRVRDVMLQAEVDETGVVDSRSTLFASAFLDLSGAPLRDDQVERWSDLAANVAEVTIGLLRKEEQVGLWIDPAWTAEPSTQPLVVRQLLAMYAAAAARDAAAMAATSKALLASADFDRLAADAREQALVVAQLAAIAQGRMADVRKLEQHHGEDIPRSDDFRFVRAFLSTWADLQSPSTAATGR